jgi:hypothetical protein
MSDKYDCTYFVFGKGCTNVNCAYNHPEVKSPSTVQLKPREAVILEYSVKERQRAEIAEKELAELKARIELIQKALRVLEPESIGLVPKSS